MFGDAINQAKEEFKKNMADKLSEKNKIEKSKWGVPILISYNDKYKEIACNRSIMVPLYMRKPSYPEKQFIEMLDNSAEISWWHKNGENDGKYFAILYKDSDGFEHSFYVDFIVKYKDGRVGLYDTKGGETTEGAKYRAEGLHKYIMKEKKRGTILDGGIVIFEVGSFWINRNEPYR